MINKKEDEDTISTVLLIIFGASMILGGTGFIIQRVIYYLLGGPQSNIFLVGLIIIVIGLFFILFHKRYPIRFVIGAIMLFISSILFLYMYLIKIPQLKDSAEEFKNRKAAGEVIGLYPKNVNWEFYELFLISLIIIFISIGILLIMIYIKMYLAKPNTDLQLNK